MADAQIISRAASNNSSGVTLASTPIAGDVIIVGVAGFPDDYSIGPLPGVTWTRLMASGSLAVWVGTGATSGGFISLGTSSFGKKYVWHLRGVSAKTQIWTFDGFTDESVGITARSMKAGSDNVVLSFMRQSGSSEMLVPGTLPSVAAWSTGVPGEVEMAEAVPLSVVTYAMKWTWPATGNAKYGVQLVVGDPIPSEPLDLTQVGATETTADVVWTNPAAPPLPYADEVFETGPATYWRLGETSGTVMNDSSGNGRNGVYSGGITLGTPSLIQSDTVDKSASFFGGKGSIDYAAWMDGQKFTIEALIETPLSTLSGVRTIASRRSPNAWQFRLNSGTVEFLLWTTGGLHALSAPSKLTEGIHHVAVTVDTTNNRVRFYVDGVMTSQRLISGSFSSNSPMSVGADNGGGESYNARLDEIAYFDRELTSGEIASHNSAGLGYNGVAAIDSFEYRLDGGSIQDVGLVEAATIPSLDPGTSYLMQLRSRTGVSRSDWTAGTNVMTIDGGTDMRLGSNMVDKLYLGANPASLYLGSNQII